ncbi:MAG TPA: hypothetical protein VIR34_08275 [Gemmatimonadaceae bacterium]
MAPGRPRLEVGPRARRAAESRDVRNLLCAARVGNARDSGVLFT